MWLDYYELIAYDSGMGSLLNGVAARSVAFVITPYKVPYPLASGITNREQREVRFYAQNEQETDDVFSCLYARRIQFQLRVCYVHYKRGDVFGL